MREDQVQSFSVVLRLFSLKFILRICLICTAKLSKLLTCFTRHMLCHSPPLFPYRSCAVMAEAADGADVSVSAPHVCRDAAFLNPPTHTILSDTLLPPALCSGGDFFPLDLKLETCVIGVDLMNVTC